jgi:hypothetical protein
MKVEIYQLPTLPTSLRTSSPTSNGPLAPSGSLSNFLLENSLYFGVNEMISFQKLLGKLDKMIVANLSRQHHRSLNFYSKIP